MLERVIEERARGDINAAAAIRTEVNRLVGDDLGKLKPGSPEAMHLKEVLIRAGRLEPVPGGRHRPGRRDLHQVAADGRGRHRHGCRDFIRTRRGTIRSPRWCWRSSSAGRIVGATLGNDVNLRDVEGRSALLLGKAKDNNASCAIGPFLRLFDAGFGLDDIRSTTVTLRVEGPEGFVLEGSSSIAQDQPRSGGPGGADGQRAPPLSGRRGAVPGHDVRAGAGPRRAGPGVHPQVRATS